MAVFQEATVEAFREFRDRFCQNRHKWRRVTGICYKALKKVDEELKKGKEVRRREALDTLAEEMIAFVESRVRYLMREEYEALRSSDEISAEKFAKFREHIAYYHFCYRQSLDEIATFSSEHPLSPVKPSTLDRAEKGFAHFGTLAMAYLDIFETDRCRSE